jgi:hypothetical protein
MSRAQQHPQARSLSAETTLPRVVEPLGSKAHLTWSN